MQTTAKAKFIRMSPRKVRLVSNLIKGLDVVQAEAQLKFVSKDAAVPLAKLIKSAACNAEENYGLRQDNLFIKEIKVDGGPILYRWMPRAFGRATPIRKRSSHITVVLDERIPTQINKDALAKSKKKDTKDDLIKVEDFDELKALEKEEVKEEKKSAKDGKQSGDSRGKKKGFGGSKVFNRRSGEK